MSHRLPRCWFWLAIISLAIAGLFALPPVILRGPAFSHLNVEHIFATALVIHVDLSVLVWLLALAAMLWSYVIARPSLMQYIAFALAAMGTAIMVLGAFVPDSQPLKNNYVPMLNNDVFITGLCLFGSGIWLQLCLVLLSVRQSSFTIIKDNPIRNYITLGAISSACITFIAFICLFITYFQLSGSYTAQDGLPYYELLFWGGGHILQFTFVQLLLIGWLWVSNASGVTLPFSSRVITIIVLLNLLWVLPTPLLYVFYEAGDGVVRWFFTKQMNIVGGISVIIMGLAILIQLLRPKSHIHANSSYHSSASKLSLFFSIILFFAGGIIAMMIRDNSAQVPAHYHGSIIGITTALMGLAYILLPHFGYYTPSSRLSSIQLLCYGSGQLLHIVGLAWMGGYGALRKAPNSLDSIDHSLSKIMFFAGGSLAILGGLLFVIIALWCMRGRSDLHTP